MKVKLPRHSLKISVVFRNCEKTLLKLYTSCLFFPRPLLLVKNAHACSTVRETVTILQVCRQLSYSLESDRQLSRTPCLQKPITSICKTR